MSNRKLLQQMIGVTLVALLLVGCGAPAATPTPVPPTSTPTPVPPTPTPVPPTSTPVPTTGTIIGVLIDQATGEPFTDISLKPFAQEKVIIDGTEMWREVLPDYEEVVPDEQGAFILSDVPPGTYSIRAITGETTVGANMVPVWAFLRDAGGNVIEVEVIAGQITDLGEILVTEE
jgi:hypothetical protein